MFAWVSNAVAIKHCLSIEMAITARFSSLNDTLYNSTCIASSYWVLKSLSQRVPLLLTILRITVLVSRLRIEYWNRVPLLLTIICWSWSMKNRLSIDIAIAIDQSNVAWVLIWLSRSMKNCLSIDTIAIAFNWSNVAWVLILQSIDPKLIDYPSWYTLV